MWPPRLSLRVLRCPPRGLLRLLPGEAGSAAPAWGNAATVALYMWLPVPRGLLRLRSG